MISQREQIELNKYICKILTVLKPIHLSPFVNMTGGKGGGGGDGPIIYILTQFYPVWQNLVKGILPDFELNQICVFSA